MYIYAKWEWEEFINKRGIKEKREEDEGGEKNREEKCRTGRVWEIEQASRAAAW